MIVITDQMGMWIHTKKREKFQRLKNCWN